MKEKERIQALRAYDLLDTLPEEDLDAWVKLASEICQTPIALISLIDEKRQWFKSKIGMEDSETPREFSFCHHAIKGHGIYEVENAAEDPLFSENPYVTDKPDVRFYAGAPLTTPEGYNIGTLCVLDTIPKKLNADQRKALSMLSKLIVDQFELRKAKQELEESRRHYSNLIEQATDVIYTCDLEGRFVFISSAVEQFSGYKAEELIGRHFTEIVAEEDREEVKHFYLRQFNTNLQRSSKEFRMNNARGEKKWVEQTVVLLRHKGKKERFQGIVRDVDERKRATIALGEANARSEELNKTFQAVFHRSPVAKSLGSLNPYKYVEVNESFSRLTGYSPDELKNLDFEKNGLISGEERDRVLKRLVTQGFLRDEELQINCKDSSRKYILLSTEFLSIKGQKMVLSVYHDINDRKLLEEQLVIAKELAEESGLAKEQFLANMSHEIRTPMNAVLGFTDLLAETSLSTEQREYVNAIDSSGKSLMAVINDILDYSKIEAGMLSIEEVPLSVRSIFSSLYIAFSEQAKRKKLKLVFSSDKKIPEVIGGDPARLTQVINNLVGNAIKFTSKGSIHVKAQLESRTEKEVLITFSVKDTGIGIAPDKLSAVFERFNQGRNDTTRKYGGTGLGLSIVKKLVELQGGSVSVESKPGKGSVFKATIPYKTQVGAADMPQAEQIAAHKTRKGTVSVLLVEDNKLNQKLAEKILRTYGFKVTLASNGKVAVDKLKKASYHLILMDMQMPEMNGYETTVAIRKKLKLDTPIIAMTAHALASEKEKCLQLGMNDYISKPFKKEELYKKMIGILDEGAKLRSKRKGKEVKKAGKTTDLSYLYEIAEDDKDFIKSILETFLQDVPREVKVLESGIKAREYAVIKEKAHKLKSSLQMVGLESLRKNLDEIELLAMEKRGIDAIRKEFRKVKAVFDTAATELRLSLEKL